MKSWAIVLMLAAGTEFAELLGLCDAPDATAPVGGNHPDRRAVGTSPWPKPRRDLTATDGEKLTLGDTTLSLKRYLTVADDCAQAGRLRLD